MLRSTKFEIFPRLASRTCFLLDLRYDLSGLPDEESSASFRFLYSCMRLGIYAPRAEDIVGTTGAGLAVSPSCGETGLENGTEGLGLYS